MSFAAPTVGQDQGIIAILIGLNAPRDAASGLPTGKRQHKPVTVVAATR